MKILLFQIEVSTRRKRKKKNEIEPPFKEEEFKFRHFLDTGGDDLQNTFTDATDLQSFIQNDESDVTAYLDFRVSDADQVGSYIISRILCL